MASPYLAITDLIGRWPQNANRHEIFLVSSGIDALQPRPNDSYLEEATERAQRAGVQVILDLCRPRRASWPYFLAI